MEPSAAAFIGGAEMLLPHFTGEEGIREQLEGVVGKVEGSIPTDEKPPLK